MVSINIAPAERVISKLREQASAQAEIAATLLLKPTAEAAAFAVEHQETARLYRLLHDACATGGLLYRLERDAADRQVAA